MRKILTLLFLVPLLATAQSWAPIGATWTYKQTNCCSPDSTVAVIQVVGDTLIGGKMCRDLQMTVGWQMCYELPRFQYESNDSLFYWNELENTFELFFRWDAVPGDTWSTPVAGDTLLWTVADTGSVQVADEMLRNWTVSVASSQGIMYCPITEVTERLGPSSTPFTWVWPQCDGELYTGLRCYADSVISWLNPQVPQCGLGTPGPVVLPGATWNYNGHGWEDHGVMLWVPFVGQVECTGTEVVEGRLCSVLAPADPIGPSTWCNFVPPYLTRSNDTVYYWSGLDTAFYTLYVLNTPIGGNWTSPSPIHAGTDWYDITWTVLDTGTTEVDGIALRRLVVLSDLGVLDTLTERMGFHHFLTPWNWGLWGGCDIADMDGLRCYDDAEISWMAPAYTECWLQDPDTGIVHFDDPSNTWYVARTYPEGNIQNPNFAATRTTRYFFSGTMNFAGETWNLLHAQHTWDGSPFSTFQGAVRQVGGLVLFLDTLNVIDTLYNFNLQVGDSVRYPDFGALSPYLTVESIDTVMIAGYPHRLYHFSEYPQTLEDVFTDTWIEGMGSIHGPLAPRMPATLGYHYGFPDSTRTTCYFHWQDLLWQHPGYPACATNILLGADELAEVPITVYPNPVSDLLRVQGLSARPWTYRLVDAVGRIWASGQWPITEGPRELGVRSIPAGAYVLRIEGPGNYSFRVLKL